MANKEVKKSSNVSDGKACAVLSYLLVGIIWYFVDEKMKKNNFVKYHVKQGLVLLIASILYSLVLLILFGILFVPLMFGGAGMLLGLFMVLRLLYYIPLILAILGIINAANGSEKELPIIGKYASKFTF